MEILGFAALPSAIRFIDHRQEALREITDARENFHDAVNFPRSCSLLDFQEWGIQLREWINLGVWLHNRSVRKAPPFLEKLVQVSLAASAVYFGVQISLNSCKRLLMINFQGKFAVLLLIQEGIDAPVLLEDLIIRVASVLFINGFLSGVGYHLTSAGLKKLYQMANGGVLRFPLISQNGVDQNWEKFNAQWELLNHKLSSANDKETIASLKNETSSFCRLIRPFIYLNMEEDTKLKELLDFLEELANKDCIIGESEIESRIELTSVTQYLGKYLNQSEINDLIAPFKIPFVYLDVFMASVGLISPKDLDHYLSTKMPRKSEWNKDTVKSHIDALLNPRQKKFTISHMNPQTVVVIVKVVWIAICLFSLFSKHFGMPFFVGACIGITAALSGKTLKRPSREFSCLGFTNRLLWLTTLNPWIYATNAMALSLKEAFSERRYRSPVTRFHAAYLQ